MALAVLNGDNVPFLCAVFRQIKKHLNNDVSDFIVLLSAINCLVF